MNSATNQPPSLLKALLESSPPQIELEEAADTVERYFGLKARVSRLGGERDTNFHVQAQDGQEYVLKISSESEEVNVTNLSTAALLHIEKRDPEVPVQRVIAALNGAYELSLSFGAGSPLVTRLFSYLQGEPLFRVQRNRPQRIAAAQYLARLDLALTDFSHPAAKSHELLWDIKHLNRLLPLTDAIVDPTQRAIVDKVFEQHLHHVEPRLATLRAQVVHNDLNPHNLLVDRNDTTKVTGILDFGDIVYTPLINELAVACSYQINLEGADALSTVAEFVAAYHAVLPLLEQEVELLFDLIAERLTTTVVITTWRAKRYPENQEYILKNNPSAWDGLDRLARITPSEARHCLAVACGQK
jgi:Ser/Thr protein kinase RdoA (MazF antagonist)